MFYKCQDVKIDKFGPGRLRVNFNVQFLARDIVFARLEQVKLVKIELKQVIN